MWYFDPTAPKTLPTVKESLWARQQNATVSKQQLQQQINNSSLLAEGSLHGSFLEHTTIHGIPYFAGPKQPLVGRIIWMIMFFLSFGFCCFTLYPPFMSYLNGDIRTSILLETKKNIPFPAITFCNHNQFRRSIAGHNLNNVLWVMLARRWDSTEVNPQQCLVPNASDPYLSAMILPEEFEFGPVGMFLGGLDAFQGVISCKLNGRISCTEFIVNHLTDFGTCFTFNPGWTYRSKELQFGDGGLNRSYPTVQGEPFLATNAGPNAAVELVLNVQQFEYCDAGGPSEPGVGFLMMIHDPEVDPLYLINGAIKLGPGVKTEIQIGEKIFERNTENLGRCASNVQLNYFKNASKYQQASCYAECLTDYINEQCNCLPYYMPAEKLAGELENAAMSELIGIMCFGEKAMCASAAEKNFTSGASFEEKCPKCKTPCDESIYTIEQISSSTFPAENLAPLYMNKKWTDFTVPNGVWAHLENNAQFQWWRDKFMANYAGHGNFTSIEEMRENILAVKIYFKSMTVEKVSEEQLTGIADLATQLGGASGLFLGASVLSFFEILYWAVLSCCHHGQKRAAKQ